MCRGTFGSVIVHLDCSPRSPRGILVLVYTCDARVAVKLVKLKAGRGRRERWHDKGRAELSGPAMQPTGGECCLDA
jgi:hypothetical protein